MFSYELDLEKLGTIVEMARLVTTGCTLVSALHTALSRSDAIIVNLNFRDTVILWNVGLPIEDVSC